MKKAAIIIGVVIYAISIIVVTFLGYAAEVRNPPIFADDIVFAYELPYSFMDNGVPIYEVKSAQKRQNTGDAEESGLIDYRYELKIFEFEYLYEVLGGEIEVKFIPISNQTDPETGENKVPDVLDVNYAVGNEKMASVDDTGKIKFKKYKREGDLDLSVSTKDTTNITIHVLIHW